MKFIIEHLENDLYSWCLIEYKHISKIVGKDHLIITNVKKRYVDSLKKFCRAETKSVLDLKLKNACLLDPKAKKVLTPKGAKNFDYFIFGGILGDYPEQGRTRKYLTSRLNNAEVRSLGVKQMPTDNAVMVVKLITEGRKLSSIRFQDNIKIKTGNGKFNEEVILPFRYVVVNRRPLVSNELIGYLKEKSRI